ncbi:MAG: Hsp20/alpha crystallin family protein [Pseudobdellovibrio sp.]
MAESVLPKKAPQVQLRQMQQQQAQKKQQLMAEQKEDLKTLKQYYAEKNSEIENESVAAVNHIRTTSSDDSRNVPQLRGYNRRAQASEATKSPESQENDDFYKVQDRGSTLHDKSDRYVIEAYAPEHEKNNIRVSIQDRKAVISGQRKHSGEVADGPKKISSNNFQTFREEFKFEKPVNHSGMTRERDGDYIRFSIPKLESADNNEESLA